MNHQKPTRITIETYGEPFTVEIPRSDNDIDSFMPAILLAVELNGYSRRVIEEWIVEYVKDLKNG